MWLQKISDQKQIDILVTVATSQAANAGLQLLTNLLSPIP